MDPPANVEVGSFEYPALRQLYSRAMMVVVPLNDIDFQAGVTIILEAMAMGKPVIATSTPDQSDVVLDRRRVVRGVPPRPASLLRPLAEQLGVHLEPNGFYVPPGDPVALRRAITYLLDHPDERARRGAAGRRAVEQLMTVDQFVRRLCGLVEQACAERANAAPHREPDVRGSAPLAGR